MTELRWILLIAGILVIAAIYLFTRNRPRDEAQALGDGSHRVEPVLGRATSSRSEEVEDITSPGDDTDSNPSVYGENEQPGSVEGEFVDESFTLERPEKIVTLRVAFSADNNVPGENLTELFKVNGLRFGNLKIFHKFQSGNGRSIGPIFSVASIAEPGSFDLANIEAQVIPGLTLFMVLPNYVEGSQAFESMLDFARAVKDRFDGEVLDESGSILSIQRAGYIRDEIIDFEIKRSIRKR
jgi:cell division protein ZipA